MRSRITLSLLFFPSDILISQILHQMPLAHLLFHLRQFRSATSFLNQNPARNFSWIDEGLSLIVTGPEAVPTVKMGTHIPG